MRDDSFSERFSYDEILPNALGPFLFSALTAGDFSLSAANRCFFFCGLDRPGVVHYYCCLAPKNTAGTPREVYTAEKEMISALRQDVFPFLYFVPRRRHPLRANPCARKHTHTHTKKQRTQRRSELEHVPGRGGRLGKGRLCHRAAAVVVRLQVRPSHRRGFSGYSIGFFFYVFCLRQLH